MTVKMAENVIQLTNTPVRCSACFNQEPSLRHIDMDAACDRGYGDEAAVKVAYDDLVLCENCVKEAATLINLVPKDDGTIERLERELDQIERQRKQAVKYAQTMEEALAARPEPITIDQRKRPRQLHDETEGLPREKETV